MVRIRFIISYVESKVFNLRILLLLTTSPLRLSLVKNKFNLTPSESYPFFFILYFFNEVVEHQSKTNKFQLILLRSTHKISNRQFRKNCVNHIGNGRDNMFDILLRDVVGRCKNDVVSTNTINATCAWVDSHVEWG